MRVFFTVFFFFFFFLHILSSEYFAAVCLCLSVFFFQMLNNHVHVNVPLCLRASETRVSVHGIGSGLVSPDYTRSPFFWTCKLILHAQFHTDHDVIRYQRSTRQWKGKPVEAPT